MIKHQSTTLITKSMLTGLLAFCTLDAHALTINTVFDNSVTSSEQAAFNYAVQQFEHALADNITVLINVDGNLGGGLASTSTSVLFGTYHDIRVAVNAKYGSALLPTNEPSGADSALSIGMSTAEAKALGLASFNGVDGSISFNSNLAYATDPSHQAVAGAYDLIGIAEHEISEILGRASGLTQGSPFYTPLDFLRYTGNGVQSFSSTDTGVYFSLDGGKTNIQGFNSNLGGDISDWNGSNPADAFNAFISTNQALGITAADWSSMRAIGYTLAPVPLPASIWLFASACLGLGAYGKRRQNGLV